MPEEQNPQIPFYKVLGEITAIWTLANIGYYFFLPLFGFELSYNSSPVAIAVYFLIWAIIAVFNFRGVYSKWLDHDSHIWLYGVLSVASSGIILGLIYLFSKFTVPTGPVLSPYTDILFATQWYFLPKSIEILVQQLLVTVLVLELFFRFHSLKKVVIGYVVCFGGAHVVLYLLNGAPTSYALVMSGSAFLSSLIFPYLMLRVRGGFVYAYLIHFVFYVVLAMLLHTWPPPGYVI
ncbi:MAG: hypothetical protein QG579_291 [Patescibacteria group bacterium]|jgi:hypothetical protein|nr:hypothetical protein [Patescibacteria group bacterium]